MEGISISLPVFRLHEYAPRSAETPCAFTSCALCGQSEITSIAFPRTLRPNEAPAARSDASD
jgi:hypothetical protein